jgi:hypothetical protein
LAQVQELNEQMIDIGFEQEAADGDEVRQRILLPQEDGHKDSEWSDHELEPNAGTECQSETDAEEDGNLERSEEDCPAAKMRKDRSPAGVGPESVLVDEEEQKKSGSKGSMCSVKPKAKRKLYVTSAN